MSEFEEKENAISDAQVLQIFLFFFPFELLIIDNKKISREIINAL